MSAPLNRLILAGGSGFLGRALAEYFLGRNWEVVILTRRPKESITSARQIIWDGCRVGPWQREVDGATAVVNLTGKSVNCRYTPKNQKEIIDSRVDSTRVLGEAISGCINPPKVWINASTATIYKHTYGPAMGEAGEIGATAEAKDAFSIKVAEAWEKAFFETITPATRKTAMRTAMVLGHGENSVFPMLRHLTRLRLGGRMGDGRQYVSWVHEIDFCRAVEWLINHEELKGPINIGAPTPVPNAEMMRILRRLSGVRLGLPATKWMLELGALFLRTETELIIKSRRVVSPALLASGFEFQFTCMEKVFQDLIQNHPAGK